jgi:hypothetical protein
MGWAHSADGGNRKLGGEKLLQTHHPRGTGRNGRVAIGYEVLKAVKMSMTVLWVVRRCGLVGRYQLPTPSELNPEDEH